MYFIVEKYNFGWPVEGCDEARRERARKGKKKKRDIYNQKGRRGVRKSCKIIYVYVFNRLVNAYGAY